MRACVGVCVCVMARRTSNMELGRKAGSWVATVPVQS